MDSAKNHASPFGSGKRRLPIIRYMPELSVEVETPFMSLSKIQQWYISQCNGIWEHQFGIKIETLDNPGWLVQIDVKNTVLQEKEFNEFIKESRDDASVWINCRVEDSKFIGACGPNLLMEVIAHFIDWIES